MGSRNTWRLTFSLNWTICDKKLFSLFSLFLFFYFFYIIFCLKSDYYANDIMFSAMAILTTFLF